MSSALAALLSPAVGIAISPFPIVGLILILLSNKARMNSIFYTLGWIVGNGAIFLIAMFLIGSINAGGPSTTLRIIYAVLAVLLLALAVKDFMDRPKEGEKAKTPAWFEKMSNIKPLGAAGFAFVLSAVNPKNMLLALTAGVGVGAVEGLSAGSQIASVVVFLLIASVSILVPTIAFLIAGERLNSTLDKTRDWLIQHNSIVMSVLFLFIALSLISKALG